MVELTVERTCEHCGKGFQALPSRMNHGRGKHCSPGCQYAAIRARPKNVVWFDCLGCGERFSVPASRLRGHKGVGKYCNRACRDKHWKGPLNPNWQNGSGVYKRGSHWQAIRRRILARDKVCQHCGVDGKLHVHHRIPFRMFADPVAANADDNLVALCPPCHRKEDARSKWVAVGGGVLQFSSGSVLWQMARDKGMV